MRPLNVSNPEVCAAAMALTVSEGVSTSITAPSVGSDRARESTSPADGLTATVSGGLLPGDSKPKTLSSCGHGCPMRMISRGLNLTATRSQRRAVAEGRLGEA